MSAIAFHNTTFDVVDRSGQPWLRYLQIGDALGYSKSHLLNKVYQKHADEFTDSMTAVIKLPTAGGEQDTRIFSPRGCYALGMFARTKVAKDFRVWVLDVLEGTEAVSSINITTAQAGELHALLVERFPVGADRPYAWGRFNNHFRLASYKDLPAARFHEACDYIRTIPYRDGQQEMVLVSQHHVDVVVNSVELVRKYWKNLVPAIKGSIGYELSGSLFDVNECTRMALRHMETMVSPETKARLLRIRQESDALKPSR